MHLSGIMDYMYFVSLHGTFPTPQDHHKIFEENSGHFLQIAP